MTRVGNLDTFRQKTLTTTLAATCENGATRLSLHASAEPELTPTCALRRLISAFHRKIMIRAEIVQ